MTQVRRGQCCAEVAETRKVGEGEGSTAVCYDAAALAGQLNELATAATV